MGIVGILVILLIAFLLSNNRRKIDYSLVIRGLILQTLLAFFILKVEFGQVLFIKLGAAITQILEFSRAGASFAFGILVNKSKLEETFGAGGSFIFYFEILPAIIFISVLVSITYHFGIMQRIISLIAKVFYYLMGASGSEALSNVASSFVGQVEAQILIKPYLKGMTKSEMLASMTGSMSCIAGGVMGVYISMGIPAHYLIAASIMAIPSAFVISKIVFPETEQSETKKEIKTLEKKKHVNVMDAIAEGAKDGINISLNIIAMMIAIIGIIAMIDFFLRYAGSALADHTGLSLSFLHISLQELSLKEIFGAFFFFISYLMGIPWEEARAAGSLMGMKMVLNEFVAYSEFVPLMNKHSLSEKSILIISIALCGFANFSSIAIQVGGIGELIPERRAEIAGLGLKAMISGTLASYLSASLAGLLI